MLSQPMLQLTAFFSQYGPVKCVRQRRYLAHGKAFKGSCFVEFATVADMEKVGRMGCVGWHGLHEIA